MTMAVGCSAGAHISKSQLLFCILGFCGFTTLALGVVADYWTSYGISSQDQDQRLDQLQGSENGTDTSTGSSGGLVLSREGLWRVCYQYISYNSSTTISGHMCYFGLSVPTSMSTAMSEGELMTRYEAGYLIASWVLFGLGVVLTLVAVVMSMAGLRQKKNRTLIRGVAAVFLVAVVLCFLGLVMYAVRNSRFFGQWPKSTSSNDNSPQTTSPYSSASLGWAYGISWVGVPLCLVAGVGHLWFIRRYEDSML